MQAGNVPFHTWREAVLPELKPCQQCQKRCRHICKVSAAIGEAISLQHPVLTKCVPCRAPDVAMAWRAAVGSGMCNIFLHSFIMLPAEFCILGLSPTFGALEWVFPCTSVSGPDPRGSSHIPTPGSCRVASSYHNYLLHSSSRR